MENFKIMVNFQKKFEKLYNLQINLKIVIRAGGCG